MTAPILLTPKQANARLLTMQDVCERVGCCVKTLRKHIDAGDIRYVLIGERLKKFTEDDVQEFIKKRRRRECPSTKERIPRSGGTTSGSNVVDIESLLPSRKRSQGARPN